MSAHPPAADAPTRPAGGHLLVPVDLSEASPAVVRAAGQLARDLRAGVVFLHVVERPPGLPSDVIVKPEPDAVPVSVHEWLDGQARRALPPLHAALVEYGVDARDLVRHGDVVDTILSVADELDARMIVMGTEGRKGLQRLILGSVAERVVRRSTRPVMTVRAAPQA